MRSLRPVLLAGTCTGVAALAEIGSVVLGWGLTRGYTSVLFGLYNLAIVMIGGLIALRHPRSPIGWILAAFGVFTAVFSDFVAAYGLRASLDGWPGGPLAQWVGFGTWSPGALMWVLALLFIPTGRLPGPRWRLVAWAGCAGVLVYIPSWLLDPGNGHLFVSGRNPYTVPGLPYAALAAAGGGLLTLAAVGSLASLVVRFRVAGPVERLQLKWVALAGMVVLLVLPMYVAFYSRSAVVQVLTPIVLTVAALCLGAADLRYRLFDVDLIINRTVVYLTLTVLLAAAYGATAITLGAILGGFSSWTAAGGTLVAAVAFRPLRRAVQGVVDRRFDREQHSAAVRIDGFLDRLRAGSEQPELVEDLLRDVLRDPTLRVLLLQPASDHYSDVRGQPAAADGRPGPRDRRTARGGTQPARCRDRAARGRSQPPARGAGPVSDPGSRAPPTMNGAVFSAICTTAPSSASSRSASRCGPPRRGCDRKAGPPRRTVSTLLSPISRRPSRNCAT